MAIRAGVMGGIRGNIGAVLRFDVIVFFSLQARVDRKKMLGVPARGEGFRLLAAAGSLRTRHWLYYPRRPSKRISLQLE
jgi:hypothetical protein